MSDTCEEQLEGVYVLRLNNIINGNPCYYVGKSNNISERIKQHKSKGKLCSPWVLKNGGVASTTQPLTPPEQVDSWELKETINRMIIHGFDNVRGSIWTLCSPFTRDNYIEFKNCAIGVKDLCRNCGKSGHYADKCNSTKADWLITCDNFSRETRKYKKDDKQTCTRCGRYTHVVDNCYAKTHLNGTDLNNINQLNDSIHNMFTNQEIKANKKPLNKIRYSPKYKRHSTEPSNPKGLLYTVFDTVLTIASKFKLWNYRIDL